MRRVRVAVVVLAVVAASVVCAHDTWILARPAVPENRGAAVFDLTSGMAFPDLDHAITPDRVGRARIRVRGRSTDIRDMSGEAHSLVFRTPGNGSLLATIWVELKPKSIDLTPSQVAVYLDEIDAPSTVRKAWADRKPGTRWREVYVKHAKTFVGTAEADDRSFALAAGMSFEIIPELDPTRLRAGDEISVRVLKNGAPISGLAIGAVREGDAHGTSLKTDAEGRVRIRLEHAGRWMLRATVLRVSGRRDKAWRSDFTTLTLEVR